jgi:hypothetical protein
LDATRAASAATCQLLVILASDQFASHVLPNGDLGNSPRPYGQPGRGFCTSGPPTVADRLLLLSLHPNSQDAYRKSRLAISGLAIKIILLRAETLLVRFWLLANIGLCTAHVCLWPKADIPSCTAHVRFRG